MKRCKLRCGGRKKALFGLDSAAILAAAGIQVAGTMAAAGMQSKAARDAATQQATAIKTAATQQANALNAQNENNNRLQENSIQLTKDQNEQNRDLQKEIQMNLQLLTGQQNTNARKEASKLVARNGASVSRLSSYHSPLKGIYSPTNMPFTVTDGGGVRKLAVTPEGYDLYEIIGNDHNHYHKTKGGKNKTGVGFKFANGNVVEGEGNQNTNKGELLLVTPDDAQFISKHSIGGFNPADAVLSGMHPLAAFNIQERIKQNKGMTSDGRKVRRKLRTIGGVASSPFGVLDVANTPDFSTDIIAPTATGVAYITQNNAETNQNNANYGSTPKYSVAKYGCKVKKRKKCLAGGNSNYYWASGLNTLGNIGGAILNTVGNNRASRILTAANLEAAGLMANAYNNLKGIDANIISREDFAAPHALAAVQAPVVNTNTERTIAERSLQRRLSDINRNTLSSAAAQDRANNAEVDYNDIINKIEDNANARRQQIMQGNMERITQVANENANRDAQANREYYNNLINVLQYNNDIDNNKILGVAGAYSDAITQNASIRGNAIQANSQSWGNALSSSANTFANALGTIAQNDFSEKVIQYTSDPDTWAMIKQREAQAEIERQIRKQQSRLSRMSPLRASKWIANNIKNPSGIGFPV